MTAWHLVGLAVTWEWHAINLPVEQTLQWCRAGHSATLGRAGAGGVGVYLFGGVDRDDDKCATVGFLPLQPPVTV